MIRHEHHRRSLLTAAPGFLHLHYPPAEVTLLHRWLDTWSGLGDVITGLTRQGLDVELRQGSDGWRAHLYPTGVAHSISLELLWLQHHGGRCRRRGGGP
jgi:hypothetical protein